MDSMSWRRRTTLAVGASRGSSPAAVRAAAAGGPRPRAGTGLGPFAQVNGPIVGTDKLRLHGARVPNLVANQESPNYGPNYHARSDEFDKADLRQLRLNAAIAAALTLGLAKMDRAVPRHTARQLDSLVMSTDLAQQMKAFNVYDDWATGKRGLRPWAPTSVEHGARPARRRHPSPTPPAAGPDLSPNHRAPGEQRPTPGPARRRSRPCSSSVLGTASRSSTRTRSRAPAESSLDVTTSLSGWMRIGTVSAR